MTKLREILGYVLSTQCNNALFADMPDFEDMLQFESAYAAGCDVRRQKIVFMRYAK